MVSWWWVPVAAWLGVSVGFTMAAIGLAARGETGPSVPVPPVRTDAEERAAVVEN
jgi:hypothetical protein